ncbi:MAG: PIN domain-containing protein [Spirochaetaceae bacterium]
MSAKYFLDTNILVYAHDTAYPEKQQRAQNLIFEGMRETTGVISVQVLNEFFVTATKKIEQPLSIPSTRHILLLLSHLEVVDLDYDMVIRATGMQQEYHISHWDAMILSAAERAECGILYSEDLSHRQKYCGIECINPL